MVILNLDRITKVAIILSFSFTSIFSNLELDICELLFSWLIRHKHILSKLKKIIYILSLSRIYKNIIKSSLKYLYITININIIFAYHKYRNQFPYRKIINFKKYIYSDKINMILFHLKNNKIYLNYLKKKTNNKTNMKKRNNPCIHNILVC
jgi:hypothetical protein